MSDRVFLETVEDAPAKFWMVYGMGKNPPSYPHAHKSDAVTEAERLARKYPETTFVILESVECVKTPDYVRHFKPGPPAKKSKPSKATESDDCPY